jgi:hypothetical protein
MAESDLFESLTVESLIPPGFGGRVYFPTDKRRNSILRLHRPLEPWFNETWRPGEIELVK